MKIKAEEFTRETTFLSHMILDCLTSEVIKKLDIPKDRTKDHEYDVVFTFEGIELDLRRFAEHLEKAFDSEAKIQARPEAERIFEEMKHTFISKNSTNAKLESIRKQVVKVNEQMVNINNALANL